MVFADGTTAELAVADNVYAFHVEKKPKEVRLVDPEQGRVTVPIAGYGSGWRARLSPAG